MRRALLWLIGVLGGLIALVGLAWLGYNLYVQYVVAANPSTQEVVHVGDSQFQLGVYSGGDQVLPGDSDQPGAAEITATPPATSPTPQPAETPQPSESPTATTTSGEVPAPLATETPSPPTRPILPPTQLTIPKIGVDVPVVLADNDNLPRFKAAGWFLGTGYPGFRGNVVLFGHLNGVWETFARLHELAPGDEVVVVAAERSYRYKVAESKVVPGNDVQILAPTADSRLTLVTCTGTFYPETRSYSHRLIVTAILVAS